MNYNQIICSRAAQVLAGFPDGSIDLVITSPPYWQSADGSLYDGYLAILQSTWSQCARVLRPNGKLCINAPIMPIPNAVIQQHTRHLKNIAFDIERRILDGTDLERYSLFVWQKQTSKMMFGSYPYPSNPIENNTIEFVNVFVKPGKPPKFSLHAKDANKIGDAEWRDLVQQVWFMYPQDVARSGHPNPFPPKLPGRLIRMYTHGPAEGFDGEIVLDPFCGSGTTCVVAKQMGRRFIGIDVVPEYVELARRNVADACVGDVPVLLVGRPKYAGKDELIKLTAEQASNSGKDAEAQHKTSRYGTRRTTRSKRLSWRGHYHALAGTPSTDRETDMSKLRTYSTDGPICPHCERRFTPDDPSYYDQYQMTEIECDQCGKTFKVEVEHSVSWSCMSVDDGSCTET